MFFSLNQTKSGMSCEYDVIKSNEVIATASVDNNLTYGGTVTISFPSEQIEMALETQLSNILREKDQKEYSYYVIKNKFQEELGSICRKETGKGIFSRYEYYSLTFGGISYDMFMVGMGKEGYKFPIYEGNNQIALIEKDCVVYNNLDEYQISVLDAYDYRIAVMLCLYLDIIAFANRGEVMKESVKKSISITTNKELKSKYQSDFKEKCE